MRLKNSRTRIIEFIIDLTRKYGQRVGYEILIRGTMTHHDIACLTSTFRQTVTTVLNELRQRRFLTFNRRRILILDMDKLLREAFMTE